MVSHDQKHRPDCHVERASPHGADEPVAASIAPHPEHAGSATPCTCQAHRVYLSSAVSQSNARQSTRGSEASALTQSGSGVDLIGDRDSAPPSLHARHARARLRSPGSDEGGSQKQVLFGLSRDPLVCPLDRCGQERPCTADAAFDCANLTTHEIGSRLVGHALRTHEQEGLPLLRR